MLSGYFQTEDISWITKRTDLTAAVAEYLVGKNCPAGHLVEIFGRLAFALDFGTAAKMQWKSNVLDSDMEGFLVVKKRVLVGRAD